MSERNDQPRMPSSTSPGVPVPSVTLGGSPIRPGATETLASTLSTVPPASSPEQEARERITTLEREARALGTEPQAALLFHEMGRLWEDPLKNPRNAAMAYNQAYRLAPRFLANIRAARRLFADVGNWQMAVQLLEAELNATEAPSRAALLFEKGTLLEERLSREEDATAAFRQCLELKPQDIALLTQLEAIFATRNDYASLVEVYRLLATTLEAPALRAHYLTAAGLVLDERLKRPDQSAACFRDAFALDREDLLLLNALKRVAVREGRAEELLEVLTAEAEVLGPQGAPAWLQLSKMYERLGRKEEALAALLDARRVSPHEPLILSALANIYETRQRFEELADVLLAWVGCINDESELVAINLRLAALYEEDLKRDADAIARYQAIIARIPGHVAALAGLGKLFYRMQNWEGLVSVFDAESAAAQDPKEKAARMFKAAEVLEERLGRQEEAIQRYNTCLQLQPGYLPSQKALTRLYERQSRFAELVAMYEQDLLQTQDRDQIITTLNKVSLIYEERLSDLDHAIECMRRILDLASDHLPTIRNLSRLLERAGRFQELIRNQDLEASLVGDTKQVLSLYHRNAEILDEYLKDRAGAIAAYERVLTLTPSYLPALKALGRLYAQESKWEQLIRMYRAEAEFSPNPEAAAALIYKIGELCEHRLKDEHQAVASFQEVLTLAPSHFSALRALARLYKSQGAWESLIEVLRAEAANRTDPLERANAIYQAATIWEDQLKRPDMAIEVFQEVLRLAPGHTATLRALERLYLADEDVKQLVALLDRETQMGQTAGAKVAAYVKLARLYLDHFQEPARAAQCCEAVLALEPQHLVALKTLERIRSGDRARRGELRLRLAELVKDGRLGTALRVNAATDLDKGADVEALRRAVAENPRDVRLAFALERALRQTGDAVALSELYMRRLQVVSDELERVELLLRCAELDESRLNNSTRAEQAYRAALQLQPQCLPAMQGLRRVLARRGDTASARTLLESEARASKDPRSAIDAFIAAARLAAGPLQDSEGAIALYRQALEKDPLDATATAGLEDLLASRGGAADLAVLQERRGEARLAQRDSNSAAGAFFGAAKTYLSALGNRARAQELLARTLSLQPANTEALELHANLLLEDGRHADAAAAFAQRIQLGGEPAHLAKLHLTLGALYQDHLSEPSRAATHLHAAREALPHNTEVLERMASLFQQVRNWAGAVECLRRLLEQDLPVPERARHTVTLAQLHEQGLGDGASASTLYRQALELTPGDATLVDRLVGLYERAGNLPELAQMLETQAAQAWSAGDAKRAASLRVKVADLYAGPLEDPNRAVTLYRQIVDGDSANVPARSALANLYMRDAAASQLAIEEHRQLLRLEPSRVESLHALFRLWEGLKQNDKAFCAAAVLQFLRSANEVEMAFYTEMRSRLPMETQERLSVADVDAGLMYPTSRGPLVEVLRAVGDQLSKLHPPQFELLGVDRKTDKLKPDHAVFKALRSVAQVFGVEEFEVYQARRGLIGLETTEPLSVCVGQDVVRRFNIREQKFLFGRAVMGLLNKTAVLTKLSRGETVDLFGNSVRIYAPQFTALGRNNEELVKQYRRAYSRKALKALEPAALELGPQSKVELEPVLEGLSYSADRAGMLMCGDVSVGLTMVLREDPNFATARVDQAEPLIQALRERADLQQVLSYILTDDFMRLRQRLGLSVP
ncbi:tetratricopeptide repeat protein [Vitiosangium sp. GDMCC 1.1324]|uniref:tetratricopeptide repeat protein n=1 Tax=Vitiosangium sp. (strain GDMCC 1.1324) TaxID=2138576 RepID=UPI000D36AF49|nr:tetratricopeptide repeat protein [Vitiosangium sp. GDMCC 1.1324]PTL76885.1 Adventurous gliding motility protein K [Vitiosangium sp. GDMCC 1.1324]